MGDNKLNVAVVGGGMGGLCLAIGLSKIQNINVQVYEAAHHFSEIGAGVAFGPNAGRALHLIGPELEEAYLSLATHNGWKEKKNEWFEFRYGMDTLGGKEGEYIAAPRNETGQSTVHRAKFLDKFVHLLPEGVSHFGKRLIEVEELKAEDGGGVKLHFTDETTATAHCVIGADGVHSAVRRYLLGDSNPASYAIFSTSVAYRALVPMQEAVEALGEEFAQNSYIWVGKGGSIMTYPIDFGETYNIVAIDSSYQDWEGPWVQKAQYTKIAEDFANWGSHAQKIIKLLDRPETSAWSMWDHLPASTYCHKNVAMLGDAAHASTPFQGQGAGQAIEDAFVISRLFQEVTSPDQIPLAFRAYDRIRRPRSLRVCRTSRENGELVALRLPGVEDNAESIKENIDWRMDWIWHRDIQGEANEALAIYHNLLENPGNLYDTEAIEQNTFYKFGSEK